MRVNRISRFSVRLVCMLHLKKEQKTEENSSGKGINTLICRCAMHTQAHVANKDATVRGTVSALWEFVSEDKCHDPSQFKLRMGTLHNDNGCSWTDEFQITYEYEVVLGTFHAL